MRDHAFQADDGPQRPAGSSRSYVGRPSRTLAIIPPRSPMRLHGFQEGKRPSTHHQTSRKSTGQPVGASGRHVIRGFVSTPNHSRMRRLTEHHQTSGKPTASPFKTPAVTSPWVPKRPHIIQEGEGVDAPSDIAQVDGPARQKRRPSNPPACRRAPRYSRRRGPSTHHQTSRKSMGQPVRTAGRHVIRGFVSTPNYSRRRGVVDAPSDIPQVNGPARQNRRPSRHPAFRLDLKRFKKARAVEAPSDIHASTASPSAAPAVTSSGLPARPRIIQECEGRRRAIRHPARRWPARQKRRPSHHPACCLNPTLFKKARRRRSIITHPATRRASPSEAPAVTSLGTPTGPHVFQEDEDRRRNTGSSRNSITSPSRAPSCRPDRRRIPHVFQAGQRHQRTTRSSR
jgi:hypothetical protein